MMMQDLSVWRGYDENGDLFSVGWLGEASAFAAETPTADYVRKLTKLCAAPLDFERSYNTCPFCDYDPNRVDDEFFKTYGVDLGHHMIIVEGRHRRFVAPSLILHYVVAHRYKAPSEFVEAVLESA